MDYPKNDTIRELVCELTQEEIDAHMLQAAEDAELLDKFEEIELAAKEKAKKAREEAALVLDHLRYRLACVRTRQEMRAVDCYEQYDAETEKMVTVRKDTGALIDSRHPNEDERQGELRMLELPESSDDRDLEDRKPAGS